MPEEKLVGKIIHYYGNIGVGIIELADSLSVGDKLHFKSSSTDFEQTVESIQIEHQNIESAKAGDTVGLKVEQKVKENDEVFKVVE